MLEKDIIIEFKVKIIDTLDGAGLYTRLMNLRIEQELSHIHIEIKSQKVKDIRFDEYKRMY